MQKTAYHRLLEKLQFLSLSLVAISLPWPIHYNSWTIVFFALILLISFRRAKSYNKDELLFVVCCFLYFLIHLLYFFYNPNQPGAWAEVERKVTLVFFPLMLLNGSFSPLEDQKDFSKIFNLYI